MIDLHIVTLTGHTRFSYYDNYGRALYELSTHNDPNTVKISRSFWPAAAAKFCVAGGRRSENW